MATPKKTAKPKKPPVAKPPRDRSRSVSAPHTLSAPADALGKDSLASLETYGPVAEKEVSASSVLAFNGIVDVLLSNVQAGLDAVAPYRDKIVERYPDTDFARFDALPSIARAVILAATLAAAPPATAKDVLPKLEKLRALRPVTLAQLEVFANPSVALVAESEVRAIRAGTGPLDEARDAVAIALVFTRDKAKLAGKHPFTDEQVRTLRELGDWLLAQLVSTRGKEAKPTERNPYRAQRDLLWTLLVQRHDALQRAATAVFSMNEVEAKIPSLYARTNKSEEKSKEDPPSPEGDGA